MREVLHAHMESILQSGVLKRLGLEKGKYILVSAHREENIDLEDNFMSLMHALNHMAEVYQMPVIYSTHPRARKWIEKRRFVFHPLVQSMQPFGFFDYNHLQMNAFCVASDSGTLSEESAILKFPGVLIRTSTERPEALDAGSILIGGICDEGIEQAVNMAVEMFAKKEPLGCARDYMDENVSIKVVKLIQSYTDIVRRTVWLEH